MFEVEKLADDFELCISKNHRFGTDAFLLADFAKSKVQEAVWDICAGCGIIGFLLFLKTATKSICAVEIQQEAVNLMNCTVARNRLVGFEVKQGDIRNLNVLPEMADLVVCNPPYKATSSGILNKKESAAIARHEVLCNILDVCKLTSRLLKVGGRICLSQRPERLVDTLVAMRTNKLEPKRLRMVCSKPHKAPWLFLVEGRKCGKSFLKVEAPLFLENESGFTLESLKIYGK
ncbi:MAG: methyltransferase [Oscillospiraceae bacterium]|jgi:tRNA1(Val) A37 N6-methylase TrmN6|nr:methyltransferase [Oscillospiraceae bacterium]